MKYKNDLFQKLVEIDKSRIASRQLVLIFILLTLSALLSVIVSPSIKSISVTLLIAVMMIKMISNYRNYNHMVKEIRSKF